MIEISDQSFNLGPTDKGQQMDTNNRPMVKLDLQGNPHHTFFTDSSMEKIDELKKVFDADYYSFTYPDYREKTPIPLLHYINYGWRQGFNPSPYFNTIYYLSIYPEVIEKNISPIEHFLQNPDNTIFPYPEDEIIDMPAFAKHIEDIYSYHVSLSGIFDTKFYKSNNPDIGNEIDVAQHFFIYGWKEGRNPSLCFDISSYVQNYMETDQKINPVLHFMANLPDLSNTPGESKLARLQAHAEFNGLFDADFYESCNPDLELNHSQLFVHYLLTGWKELRNPSPYLNTRLYLDKFETSGLAPILDYILHPALEKKYFIRTLHEVYKAACVEAEIHPDFHVHIGEVVGHLIKSAGGFDPEWYLTRYPDVQAENCDPFLHFCQHGVYEGRTPGEEFDLDFYQLKYMQNAPDRNPLLHYAFTGRHQDMMIATTNMERSLREDNRILYRHLKDLQDNIEEYRNRAVKGRPQPAATQANEAALKKSQEEVERLKRQNVASQKKCKTQLDFFVDQLEAIFKRKS